MHKFPWYSPPFPMSSKPEAREVSVSIDRDSVCAGDDTEPHDVQVWIQNTASISDLLEAVAGQNYLPGISGDKATWLIVVGQEDEKIIGVAAEQWNTAKLIIPHNTPLTSLYPEND